MLQKKLSISQLGEYFFFFDGKFVQPAQPPHLYSRRIFIKNLDNENLYSNIVNVPSDGTSPSGKASGFGPDISEVRVLPSQNYEE